eukprot:TRINITY_DN27355_c0_g1_i1.p1 TRINITY_DN27355_c0_g1~~TRINITY_DN27355_c0_g1_i1.p1  ORF type:complete len:362 (+),score=68.86 TRINITY_DN27355_c0_g1_i1:26-1087(+)
MRLGNRTLAPDRRVLKGHKVTEILNQYNPANPAVGKRPYGMHGEATVEQYRLGYRQKLVVGDELNPVHTRNWRRYEVSPKENRNNPDSFHYEHYKHGGKAYKQVFLEDMQRLMEFPEKGLLVVDVRSNMDMVKHHIPFSIRIPMEEVSYALQLTPEQFTSMYGTGDIEKGLEIVCVSHDGISSEKALKEFERWGHAPENLYNFRGGTNMLFNESLTDWGSKVEDVDASSFADGKYPISRPDYLSTVGPLHEKFWPYPAEGYDEQIRRDSEGTWEYKVKPDTTQPVGKHPRKQHAYMQQIDGQWLRARFTSDIQWYDFSHRESRFRWRDPDLAHDRAFRPSGFRYNQFWRTVPQ